MYDKSLMCSFQGAKLAMDATRKFDSIARCLNHSLEPNIRFHPPFVIDLKGGLPRIASYALRDICRGEEIVIDYGVRDGHITWLRNREVCNIYFCHLYRDTKQLTSSQQ